MDSEASIEFIDVVVEVAGRRFLDGVSFVIPAGQTVVIGGAPGSGKSFIPRLVLGLPGVQEGDGIRLWGDVKVGGQSVFDLDENGLCQLRRRIGMVMWNGGLIDNMDVERNITLPLVYHALGGGRGVDVGARCRAEAEELGIAHLLRSGLRPVALNREEKVRVAMARARIDDPAIFMVDDPFGGMDDATVRSLVGAMCRPLGRGVQTRIITTSRLLPLLGAGERFWLVEEGALVDLGEGDRMRLSDHAWIQAELEGAVPPL